MTATSGIKGTLPKHSKNAQGGRGPLLVSYMYCKMIKPLILEFYSSLSEMARNHADGNKDKQLIAA
jgi:hypothetical protein